MSGDGVPDVLVGAPYVDDIFQGADTGEVWVLSGVDGSPVFSVSGAWGGGNYGLSVAGLGDVNGDGTPDFIAGAPSADSNGVDSGNVRVQSRISGAPAPWIFDGQAGTLAGSAVADMGDIDLDGRADFAYGAPLHDFFGSVDVGLVSVRSGKFAVTLDTILGPSGSQFGSAIAGFDVNKDSREDILVGAAAHTVSLPGAGLARLILLGVSPPSSYCTAKVNSAGCTPSIYFAGAPSLTTGSGFTVRAQNILKDVPGIMIWSPSSAAIPFGGGTLCLDSPAKRTAVRPRDQSSGCPAAGASSTRSGLRSRSSTAW